MQIPTKTKLEANKKTKNRLKPLQIAAKTKRKAADARTHTRILSPGRPSDKNITRHVPTQLPHARHARNENEADLPVTGEG